MSRAERCTASGMIRPTPKWRLSACRRGTLQSARVSLSRWLGRVPRRQLRGLELPFANKTNCGKAAALVRGFAHALEQGAVAVATLDGDRQHRPEDIPRLIEAARHHPRHIVIGARLVGWENAPRSRRRANRIANFWIGWAAGHRIVDSQSGFRLYPAEVLTSVHAAHDRAPGFVFESEILIAAARKGFRTTPVAIEALYPRAARPSHFAPVREVIVQSRGWSRGAYLRGAVSARTVAQLDRKNARPIRQPPDRIRSSAISPGREACDLRRPAPREPWRSEPQAVLPPVGIGQMRERCRRIVSVTESTAVGGRLEGRLASIPAFTVIAQLQQNDRRPAKANVHCAKDRGCDASPGSKHVSASEQCSSSSDALKRNLGTSLAVRVVSDISCS